MTFDKEPGKYQLIERGLGGITAYYPNDGSRRVSIPDLHLEEYYEQLIEGGVVLDKYELLEESDKAVSLVYHSPLLDTSLSLGERVRCPEPSDVLLTGLEGEFFILAAMRAINPRYRGLDSVGLEEYVGYWRQAGAKVGVRHGSRIEWEARS